MTRVYTDRDLPARMIMSYMDSAGRGGKSLWVAVLCTDYNDYLEQLPPTLAHYCKPPKSQQGDGESAADSAENRSAYNPDGIAFVNHLSKRTELIRWQGCILKHKKGCDKIIVPVEEIHCPHCNAGVWIVNAKPAQIYNDWGCWEYDGVSLNGGLPGFMEEMVEAVLRALPGGSAYRGPAVTTLVPFVKRVDPVNTAPRKGFFGQLGDNANPSKQLAPDERMLWGIRTRSHGIESLTVGTTYKILYSGTYMEPKYKKHKKMFDEGVLHKMKARENYSTEAERIQHIGERGLEKTALSLKNRAGSLLLKGFRSFL